ncbi:hypothetical protein RRG08_045306 [Elysia crispata]|uniref:Uncharacterized protein n=1 Tax=Elysia crispata TaxID=231223 RepID=A0AAE1A310_9GAST|nr:hypothetical protein RRG08_045306 [Elysia crispata]
MIYLIPSYVDSGLQLVRNSTTLDKESAHSGFHSDRRRSSQPGGRASSADPDPLTSPAITRTTGQTLMRILRLNKPEWPQIVVGCAGALCNGAVQTAAMLIVAESLKAFAADTPSQQKHEFAKLTYYSIALGVVAAVAFVLQEYMFGLSGEALTKNVRSILFQAMVRQDIAWFDDAENETGKLTARLSLEASAVQGALKTSLGYSTLACGTVISSFVVAFVLGWRLALMLVCFVPLTFISGLMSMKVYSGAFTEAKAVMEDVSRDAMESVGSIRTVASLTKEMAVYKQVETKLWTPYKKHLRSSFVSCLVFGLTTGLHYISFAVAFWYGARLLRDDRIKMENIFRSTNVCRGLLVRGSPPQGRPYQDGEHLPVGSQTFAVAFWYGARLLRDDRIKMENIFRFTNVCRGLLVRGSPPQGRPYQDGEHLPVGSQTFAVAFWYGARLLRDDRIKMENIFRFTNVCRGLLVRGSPPQGRPYQDGEHLPVGSQTFAVAFWYGARLLRDDRIKMENIFRVLGPMILGIQQVSRILAFAPDAGKSLKSAARVFELQDRLPAIDAYSSKGDKPSPDTLTARIKFSNLHYRYAARPDVKILNGLDLRVEPGQTLALVGESGCGKSTTVQLVERFYDPELGSVYLDKYNLKDLNLTWLRAQIGLVSQEPILFDQSIAENIAYGDNSRTVSMDEIIQAAKSANIHNFIQSLPMGYETNVGSKGTQLSGGQKQRVAIARALIRNPKVLLLDEATSALDAESEKIVQEALDKARAGRTCITIAHRLTTIKDADKIAVFKNGVVHEIGTHDTLMAKQGLYFKLQKAQNKT